MKFVHCADLHLGAPFKGLRSSNAEVADALGRATYRAFDRILDLAISKGAGFVLFSGDIYDAKDRNLRAQLRFKDGLRRLDERGIKAFVIHGNHDPLDGTAAALDWPPNTHTFLAQASPPCRISCNGEEAAIYGYSYPQQEVRQSVLSYYKREPGHDSAFQIGLLHGSVGGDPNHDTYAPCSQADLAALRFDYWALGHVHSYQEIRKNDPAIVYPGTPQGLSPRETGAHGCCLVETAANREVKIEFVPTDSIRWAAMDVSIDSMEGEGDLMDVVSSRLSDAVAKEGCSVIARVRLVGRGPLHVLLQRQGSMDTLTEDLRRNGAGELFFWLDELFDDTRPDVDREQLLEIQDARGDFLRLCREARQDQALRKSLQAHLGSVFNKRDLEGLIPTPEEGLDAWIDRAEALGLDLLLREVAS